MKIETKLTEPEKAGIYGKFAKIKEESTKPVGYHLIGDMISDAQDAKTKRVIVEDLIKNGINNAVNHYPLHPVYSYWQEFKKWAE